ncbi:MAG: hypothetical protein M1510_00130 [Nitrospirae bacterium]|nr:hypothetical protein [Nitrospirota bacterium]
MSFIQEDTLSRACRILFESEATVTRTFLHTLQPSGISNAFRKKALATHPDRVALLDEETRKKSTELFIEADWARAQLIKFCRDRDDRIRALKDNRAGAAREQVKKHYYEFRQSSKFHSGTMPQRRLFFGEFLYYSGVVPWHAFIKALVWQRRQRPRFGDLARRWRYLSEQEIRLLLLRKKFCEPIGETAVRMHSLNQFQVNTILFHQMFIQKPIGEYFIEYGHLTRDRVEYLLKDFKQHNSRFIGN